MKRPKKKVVKKFGGTDDLGKFKEEGNYDTFKSEMSGREYISDRTDWDAKSVEAQSETNLEHDEGYGDAAIIRQFKFGVNPEAFAEHRPTKQELFNSHYKGIEKYLWRDGMKVMPEVNPRVVLDEDGKAYTIFVGAKPMKGHILHERPQTLSDIAHERPIER